MHRSPITRRGRITGRNAFAVCGGVLEIKAYSQPKEQGAVRFIKIYKTILCNMFRFYYLAHKNRIKILENFCRTLVEYLAFILTIKETSFL